MSIEKFDEVDEHDQPTGKKVTKQQAHDGMLVHRCAAVYVFDQNGDLYVQVHKVSGDMLDHTVGGHVSAGETYAQAAYREMEEEIGLTTVALKEIVTGLYSHERRYIHMFGVYECTAPSDWQFMPTEEVDLIYTKPLEVIVSEMNATPELYTGGFINTMKAYIKYKNLPYIIETEL